MFYIRRADRKPSKHSKVCSCHFRRGKKSAGPEIFKWNADKLFPSQKTPPKKKKKPKSLVNKLPTVKDTMAIINAKSTESSDTWDERSSTPTEQIILEAELNVAKQELNYHQDTMQYQKKHYSVSILSSEVIRMETGLPTKEIFTIVVDYTAKFKDSISYYCGWKVESITFEDQIVITLMKLRQNYTNLHLAQLFSCSVGTISNIVITFVHILHTLLFDDLMRVIPSRNKNCLCSPSSFSEFSSCRIIIDCTDIEVATPSLMSQQNVTYSSYRTYIKNAWLKRVFSIQSYSNNRKRFGINQQVPVIVLQHQNGRRDVMKTLYIFCIHMIIAYIFCCSQTWILV